MRYRKLSPTGDFTIGQNGQNFLVNSPAAVAQSIRTRLLLFQGTWFLDLSAGVPWLTQVMGYGTQQIYDQVIQEAIVGTQGVLNISSYSSTLDKTTRALRIQAIVITIYGNTEIDQVIATASGFGIGGFGDNPFGDPA